MCDDKVMLFEGGGQTKKNEDKHIFSFKDSNRRLIENAGY